MPIGLSTAILGSAAIAGAAGTASSLIGSSKQAKAAREAAAVQSAAADKAANTQLQMFGQTREDLNPYRAFGSSALPGAAALLGFGAPGAAAAPSAAPAYAPQAVAQPNWNAYIAADPGIAQEYAVEQQKAPAYLASQGINSLQDYAQWHWNTKGQTEEGRLNPLTGVRVGQAEVDPAYASYFATPTAAAGQAQTAAAPAMDPTSMQAFLENTPGYQFTRDQGLKAVTSNLNARGLGGGSGALGKGLARFVTGLADQTYGSQVDRYMKAIGVGEDAAKATGTLASQTGANVASTMVGGAQAQASGITGAANASAAGTIGAANALGSIANAVPNAMITDKVLGMYANGQLPKTTTI